MKQPYSSSRSISNNMVAPKAGDIEYVKLLLENGADLNCKDANGSTPLHIAVKKRNQQVAELLIQRGASMIVKNNFGLTPRDESPEFFDQLFTKGQKRK